MRRRFPAVAVVMLLVSGAVAEAQADASKKEIAQVLTRFVTAFDNLDWPQFRACFAAEPTIFHPSAPNQKRIDSPQAFDAAWRGVFERIRKESGRMAPPYMDLRPLDLRIEVLSPDVGLVTFHLLQDKTLSRRTLVFRQYTEGWKIVHIHASNLEFP